MVGQPNQTQKPEVVVSDALTQRLERWKTKLLDVSLSNPLLALRANRGLNIWSPNPWKMAQTLWDGEDVSASVFAAPISLSGGLALAIEGVLHPEGKSVSAKESPAQSVLEQPVTTPISIEDIVQEQATTETHVTPGKRRLRRTEAELEEWLSWGAVLASKKSWPLFGYEASSSLDEAILVDADPKSLQDTLSRMERSNRLREEEAGIHTLFLAVGLVEWFDGAEKPHMAPLVLMPVSLSRTNARSPYCLSLRDDHPVINPALMHVLSQNSAIDPTPLATALDQDRIDFVALPELARTVFQSTAVVHDEARLVLLSYAKHKMWQDLSERMDDLKRHDVLQKIIDPSLPMSNAGDIPWEKMDQELSLSDISLPLPADASQLRAIARVDRGESLVIQGPPGTGKSQTIANMIAHLMSKGKRVLFVAEKLTALGVVHQRLSDLGLGPFCLELHTKSSNKKYVLQQLQQALSAKTSSSLSGFDEAAHKVETLRQSLNSSLDIQHHKHPNGLSMFDAIGVVARHDPEKIKPLNGLMFKNILSEDKSLMMDRRSAGVKFAQVLGLKNPLSVLFDPWRNAPSDLTAKVWDKIEQLSFELSHVQSTLSAWSSLVKVFPPEKVSAKHWSDLSLLMRVWAEGLGIPLVWRQSSWEGSLTLALEEFQNADREYAEIWRDFDRYFHKNIIKTPQESWRQWAGIEQQSTITKWWALRSWNRLHQHVCKTDVPDHVWRLWTSSYMDVYAAYERVEKAAKKLRLSCPAHEDWSASTATFPQILTWSRLCLSWKNKLSQACATSDFDFTQEIEHHLKRDAFLPPSYLFDGEIHSSVSDLWEKTNALVEELDVLMPEPKDLSLGCLTDLVNTWLDAQGLFANWLSVEKHRQNALSMGLDRLVTAIERHEIEHADVGAVLDVSYATSFVHAVRLAHPEAISYQGMQREHAIEEYQDALRHLDVLARQKIVNDLAKKIYLEDLDRHQEMNVLRREMLKKIRHLPTRTLIHKIPTLLSKLKPCLMMSPLSVAEYLTSSVPDFDVVIFDEASQIPTADAVGVMSRAAQVVIVGDPKQMPPSRLFSSDLDDDPEGEVDLESILTEALASSLPTVLLNWHYRSRHESLIAFSNKTYYNGDLITFASPDADPAAVGRGLFVHDVGGLYDRGGSQTNPDEARAVVGALVAHLEKPVPLSSVGVVTFNKNQQLLIEHEWDRALAARPDLEERLALLPEPVTIKNLENVQGDERDVILFSTTFGRDSQGRFLLNFGPLGQIGGERRLNVAITRARDRMDIFTSFKPQDIDLNKVSHQGVRDLHDWLLFARINPNQNTSVRSPSLSLPDSPFELAVIEALMRRGWEVHTQVGCSGYRIDIAAIDPNNPSRYLAGIECDGATYHSFKTARDRDRQRQIILEGLGWNIVRIWSTDWFEDHQRELNRVDAKLKALIRKEE